jgi:hypothetical protein
VVCLAGTNVIATFGTWVSVCADASGTAARTVFISRGANSWCFLVLLLCPNFLIGLPLDPWFLCVGCGLLMGFAVVTAVVSVALSPFIILCWLLVPALVVMGREVVTKGSCALVGREGSRIVDIGQDGTVFVEPLVLPVLKAKRGEAKLSDSRMGAWTIGADANAGGAPQGGATSD